MTKRQRTTQCFDPIALPQLPDSRAPRGDVVRVRLDELRDGECLRSGGIVREHALVLAESVDRLPPILVHQGTMRVIDGMHRVRAARLSGRSEIEAIFFHGSLDDAFRLAVSVNVTHGLPLSLADRKVAAARIVRSHAQLSDKSIALASGLSPGTVASIRSRTQQDAPMAARIGRDGRIRPVNATSGRLAASEAIARRPEATLREIALEAGISIGTAHDVRRRMLAGQDPLPRQNQSDHGKSVRRRGTVGAEFADSADLKSLLALLRRDPSIRYSAHGRAFLQWLDTRLVTLDQWHAAMDGVPPHCQLAIMKIARECARVWNSLASEAAANVERAGSQMAG